MAISIQAQPTIPATQAAADCGAKARAVAKEFETMFASMMLKSMRDSVMRSDLVPQSMGEQVYTEMLDSQYSALIAENARLGLSDLILRQIDKKETPSAGLNALQGLQSSPLMTNDAFIPQSSPGAGAGWKMSSSGRS
jgi:Rod binding domain-containing protein